MDYTQQHKEIEIHSRSSSGQHLMILGLRTHAQRHRKYQRKYQYQANLQRAVSLD